MGRCKCLANSVDLAKLLLRYFIQIHSHKCKILLHLALAAYRVNMNNENNYVDIMIYFAKSTYQLCKIVNLTQLDLFQFSE